MLTYKDSFVLRLLRNHASLHDPPRWDPLEIDLEILKKLSKKNSDWWGNVNLGGIVKKLFFSTVMMSCVVRTLGARKVNPYSVLSQEILATIEHLPPGTNWSRQSLLAFSFFYYIQCLCSKFQANFPQWHRVLNSRFRVCGKIMFSYLIWWN